VADGRAQATAAARSTHARKIELPHIQSFDCCRPRTRDYPVSGVMPGHDPRHHRRNGAGKVHLNVDPLRGSYKADAGEIFIAGKKTS